MTVRELAFLFHPLNLGQKKILAIMNVHLDESGIHDGAKVCALAGYCGHENSWRGFEKRWLAVLHEFEVPEYHARRFFARDNHGERVGVYAGWDDRKARRFYDHLLRVIVRCRIFPVAGVVVDQEWKSLNYNERRYLTGGQLKNGKFITSGAPSKQYFLPFLQVVSCVGNYCLEGERANFFFGLDRTFSGYALKYYQEIQKLQVSYSSHLGAIDFPPTIDTMPLQAADLLAYETYQYSLKKLMYGSYLLKPEMDLAMALARAKDFGNDFKLFDRRGMEVALSDFRKENPELCSIPDSDVSAGASV